MGREADHAKALVRSSYDRISYEDRDDTGAKNRGYPLRPERHLLPRIRAGSDVLDLGCGNDVPATKAVGAR
jgi:hypothetical protein